MVETYIILFKYNNDDESPNHMLYKESQLNAEGNINTSITDLVVIYNYHSAYVNSV